MVDSRSAHARCLPGIGFRERSSIGKLAEEGVRVVVELEELVARPCGERPFGADEPAGEFAVRHRLHDGAVACKVVSSYVVQQHHKVDIAAFACLVPRAASLEPDEAQSTSKLRLQLLFRAFCPCERVHVVYPSRLLEERILCR